MASPDATEHWPMSLLWKPRRERVPDAEPDESGAGTGRTGGYGATAGSGGEPSQRSRSSLADSFGETWHKKIFPNLPKTVDNLICCLGLSLTLIALLTTEKLTGFRLYSLSMSASGIIFFAPQAPPQLNGFLVGTASAATISWALFTCLPFEVACGLAAGVVLFFYKSFNVIFPPACVLGVLISQETQRDESILSLHDWWKTALFVLSPWLSGHAILYLAAMGLSEVRKVTRRHMLRGQLAGLAPHQTKEQLRATFDKFDTSGDGFLDADELRIALRFRQLFLNSVVFRWQTRGADVSLEECEEMIGSIDADGDGVISFEEFVALHEDHVI